LKSLSPTPVLGNEIIEEEIASSALLGDDPALDSQQAPSTLQPRWDGDSEEPGRGRVTGEEDIVSEYIHQVSCEKGSVMDDEPHHNFGCLRTTITSPP